MDRENFVEYLNKKDKGVITLDDIVFIRNYIHYRTGELVELNRIEDAARSHIQRFASKLQYAVEYMLDELSINHLLSKEGQIIKFL